MITVISKRKEYDITITMNNTEADTLKSILGKFSENAMAKHLTQANTNLHKQATALVDDLYDQLNDVL